MASNNSGNQGGNQGGWLRGPVIRGLIGRVRAAHALREHHKFALVELLGLLHDAALEVGAMLVADGAAARADEVFLLDLGDVRAAAEAHARGASLAGYARCRPG
jgi:hypothetical protein